MSQRKDKKRKRESCEDSSESGSVSDVKRKRLEQVLGELRSGKDGGHTEPEVHVRRSGRTPKAKIFDDDYVTENVRVSDSHGGAAFKSAASSSSNPREEVALSEMIKKEPADFEVGHKRETRRSYQQYIEEMANQRSVPEGNSGETYTDNPTMAWDLAKVKIEVHEKSCDPVSQPASAQSDSRHKAMKQQKERTRKGMKNQLGSAGGSDELESSEWADAALSPKVRASSRTPVPKRTFPLLQTSLQQLVNEREQLSPEVKKEAQEEIASQKVRTSTRTPVPKRSFALLEGEGSSRIKEENPGREEEPREEEHQGSPMSSLSEPSPARSSSRTPVPKRAFPLLGGSSKERRKERPVPCDQGDNGDGDLLGMSETPESSSSKKRKTTTAVLSPGHVIAQGEDGSQANIKQTHSGKVKKKKLSKEFGVSGEVAAVTKKKIKRKSSKKDLEDSFVIKQETMGEDPSTKQGVHETPKSQGRPLLSKETVKNSPSRSENSISLADLASEVSKGLTSSDDVKSAKISSKKIEPKVQSGQKVKKHAAKKHSHHDSSPKKSKKNFVEASSEVLEEEQHIILKLHLPHSSDHASKSGSKKHKHRHSSESRDGVTSPKKKHHKKSIDEHRAQDMSSVGKEPAAKKKISIKFKGLSTSHIDLEVQGASSGDSAKGGKKTASKVKKKSGHSGKASDKSAPSTLIEGSGKKKKKFSEENASSVHVPIEAEQVSSLEVQRGKESNKSRSKQKEKSRQATAAGSSKKPGTTKKGSPCKKKDNEKPKVVTSYLLFCKQERPRIAKQNPGLEFSQISKKVGEAWNKLPDEEKQIWRDKAKNANRKVRELPIAEASSLQCLQPIDMAAHLRLLGESLLTIGVCLGQQNEMEVHGSMSVLLDSVLCAMSPLLFLTSQVPELNACPKPVQAAVLDNLAHIMPGIG